MSRDEHASAARRWLEEQMTLLAGLRNAQPRDPSFKSWRQNTLTVIQRIWPADRERGERFRRIPFSPPGGKSDPRAVREWFARGCGEAAALLRRLMDEVENEGVPAPDTTSRRDAPLLGDAEEAFPTLDLAASPGPAAPSLPEVPEHMVDLGGPAPTHSTVTASMSDRRPDEPLPPTLRVEVPSEPPADAPEMRPAARPAAPEPPPASEETPSRSASRRASRPSRAMKRPAAKMRLKDMLGFTDAPASEAEDVAAAAAPAPTPPPVRRRTRAQVDIGSFIPDELRNAPALGPIGSSAPAPRTSSEREAEPVPVEEPAGMTAPAPESQTLDPDQFEAATRDFLESSPVLGSTGRPVHRGRDAVRFLEPDAVAVASLATELARLEVPEHARGPLRARMEALAAALETGTPEWGALREVVQSAMEHPGLARRLMPVLLPWLDRAA